MSSLDATDPYHVRNFFHYIYSGFRLMWTHWNQTKLNRLSSSLRKKLQVALLILLFFFFCISLDITPIHSIKLPTKSHYGLKVNDFHYF
jgi:hypothetical protein